MSELAEFLRRAAAAIPADLVYGCAPLSEARPWFMAGLRREPKDLDLFVDTETFEALNAAGFRKTEDKPGVWNIHLAEGVDAYETFPGVEYSEVSGAAVVRRGSQGFRVASLHHVLKFKLASNREKDRADISKIERIFRIDPEVWRAAVHEAGHVVADHRHGFVPYEVALKGKGAGVTDSRDAWPTPETAFSYGVSCMAGLAAEEVIGVADEKSEEGASGDMWKANQTLTICGTASIEEWRTMARELIEQKANRCGLIEIAMELAERTKISGEALQVLIDSALDAEAAGQGLRSLHESMSEAPYNMALLGSLEGINGSILRSGPLPALLVGEFSLLTPGHPIEASGRAADDLDRARAIASKGGMIEVRSIGIDKMEVVHVDIAHDRVRLTVDDGDDGFRE